MKIVLVSPNSLLTLRGSEQFVLETSRRFSKAPGVSTEVVTFRRKYATEDLSRLTPDEVKSRLHSIYRFVPPGSWAEFSWLSMRVGGRIRMFDQLNRYMEFVPPRERLIQMLRSADRIYFITWRLEDILAFLPVALLAGRKRVIAGIHSRMLVRRSDLALLSLWTRLGVLKGVHTLDSQSTKIFQRLPVKVVQVPNDVDCDLFIPGEKSRDKFVVLFAGSASAAKGADLLPAIYASLEEKQSGGIVMWICSSETGQLGREISEWCKGKKDVVFQGWLSRTRMAELYRQASVLLMPSRREVQGLANLEAQATGTPVIASDLPSFRDSIRDGETGFIVREFRAEAFAQKIMELHSIWVKGEAYDMMCRAARKNAIQNFASPSGSEKLLRMISSA